jgi:hypothetical protein
MGKRHVINYYQYINNLEHISQTAFALQALSTPLTDHQLYELNRYCNILVWTHIGRLDQWSLEVFAVG